MLAILADLQGPKIRLGRFEDGPHEWPTGEQVTITGIRGADACVVDIENSIGHQIR